MRIGRARPVSAYRPLAGAVRLLLHGDSDTTTGFETESVVVYISDSDSVTGIDSEAPGDSHVVPPPGRVFIIPAENRVTLVANEIRTFTVPYENRTTVVAPS